MTVDSVFPTTADAPRGDTPAARRPLGVTYACFYGIGVGGIQIIAAFAFFLGSLGFGLTHGADPSKAALGPLAGGAIPLVVGALSIAGGLFGLRRAPDARWLLVGAYATGLVLVAVSVTTPLFIMFSPYLYILGNIIAIVALLSKESGRWLNRGAPPTVGA